MLDVELVEQVERGDELFAPLCFSSGERNYLTDVESQPSIAAVFEATRVTGSMRNLHGFGPRANGS
jgi:hypothetical protein